MMYRFICLIILILLAGYTQQVSAERARNGPITQLTLEQALELAERLHPTLAAAQARITSAAGRALQAGLWPNPELIARIEAGPTTDRYPDEAEYIVGVSQTVPLGSRLSAARQVEHLEQDRLTQARQGTRWDIQQQVRQAFVTGLYWQRVVQARVEDAELARNGVTVAQVRLDAGDTIPAEVARAEIEFHRAGVALDRARSRQRQALEAVAAALGDPTLQVESLAGTLDLPEPVPSLDTLIARLKASPFLAAAEANITTQQARIDLIQTQRTPDLSVELAYRRLGDTGNAVDVGIRLPLPLFDRQQGNLQAARADLTAAESEAQAREQALLHALRTAYRHLRRALTAATQLREVILPRAEDVLQNAETRYRNGDLSLGQLVPVRRDWTQVRLDYLDALHEVRQAWAQLSLYVDERSATR